MSAAPSPGFFNDKISAASPKQWRGTGWSYDWKYGSGSGILISINPYKMSHFAPNIKSTNKPITAKGARNFMPILLKYRLYFYDYLAAVKILG